jgi:hypothetical protein
MPMSIVVPGLSQAGREALREEGLFRASVKRLAGTCFSMLDRQHGSVAIRTHGMPDPSAPDGVARKPYIRPVVGGKSDVRPKMDR